MNNLKEVLQNLKSPKIKERQDALVSLRTVFAQDKIVTNFHISRDGVGDPRAWLSVFQAVFATVLQEKKLSTAAKVTSSANKRLAEAAGAVRWLTERTVRYLNKRVVKALFEHLLQTISHHGQLLAPVALDYIKALRCLLSYAPHIEHLEDDMWIRIVEMAFNVILCNPIKKKFENHSPSVSSVDQDIVFHLSDSATDVEVSSIFPGQKRRRAGSDTDTPRPFSGKEKVECPNKNERTSQVSVSLEQIEFASLLPILLRSSTNPMLSSDYSFLATAVLQCLGRYLQLHPPDCSLTHDYLICLVITLDQISLNKKLEVSKFAQESWSSLVDLWGGKDKRTKEALVIIFRSLLPFLDSNESWSNTSPFNCAEAIGKLWDLLDSESDNRWGAEGLNLDHICLELVGSNVPYEACAGKTFRAGHGFDSGQALSWAILELQADCASKLYIYSESVHSSTLPSSTRHDVKRIKQENPVKSLLFSIKGQCATRTRTYHLQTLIFFVERHWSLLHESLREDAVQTLLQLISIDDAVVQSWIFISFAALVCAEASRVSTSQRVKISGRTKPLYSVNNATWDTVWTHAVRRVNLSTVCRSACHTAYCILASLDAAPSFAPSLLSPQRVLAEIESLMKDMESQGPIYPFDSVCMFLVQCLKIASQDVRLYKMQLQDKILTWLIDSWKSSGVARRWAFIRTTKSTLLLLQTISGLSRRVSLLSTIVLPKCLVVKALASEGQTEVIRSFLLDARLPEFGTAIASDRNISAPIFHVAQNVANDTHDNLSSQRPRERRISTFFLKILDPLIQVWQTSATSILTAEDARAAIDISVIAIAYQASLVFNQISFDRRVMQSAAKLTMAISSILKLQHWSEAERALMIRGFEPFFLCKLKFGQSWEALLPPEVGSGIKESTLNTLCSDISGQRDHEWDERSSFLKIIWQNTDTREMFSNTVLDMRNILCSVLEEKPTTSATDTSDGFGPIRTTNAQGMDVSVQVEEGDAISSIMEVSIAFLTLGPHLQSLSEERTRDKDLMDLVLKCASERPEKFFHVCPILFDRIRSKHLYLTVINLDNFLNEIASLLQSYAYGRSEQLQLLAIQLLDSSIELWTLKHVISSEVGEKITQLCTWLSTAYRKHKIRAYNVRDTLASFLDRYLSVDPHQLAWAPAFQEEENVEERGVNLPTYLLPLMGSDDDIRVRFRVAILNARLFEVSRKVNHSVLETYEAIKSWYTVDLDNYERMLTRMLSLGNIMVVSSAVRRGPYWHLLETCIHSPLYSRHIEAILSGVSKRLGLVTSSDLFEAYASQLAYSICQAGADILRFPPRLLGYQDRRQCAEATFRSFSPTNILTGARRLFEEHCQIIQKSPDDGVRECFGDILGIQIASWFDENPEASTDYLKSLLRSQTFDGDAFEEMMRENMDDIVTALLRTLDHQSIYDNPLAMVSISSQGEKCGEVFQNLVRYRKLGSVEAHQPNLPAFSAQSLLRGLSWLLSTIPDAISKATTYHVMHMLLADLQHCPIVNEQLRLITALSLWIALNYKQFEDSTLLYTLVYGATSFFAQSDLARSAQSILEWTFSKYRKAKIKDSRLPNVLIRVCCLAHDYASNMQDLSLSDLLLWIDEQVLEFMKLGSFAPLIIKALPALPHQPSEKLAEIYSSITSENLHLVLNDHRITSNKFRLVRRLRDQASTGECDSNHFSQRDFWRLKECIPPKEKLLDDDVHAFATLLLRNCGKINSLGVEQPNSNAPRHRHRRNTRKRNISISSAYMVSARDCTILSLLCMLETDSPSQVYAAYRTLRLMLSVLPPDVTDLATWPLDYKIELQYLQTYRQIARVRPVPNLAEILASDAYIETAEDFPQWISMMSNLLCDVLSVNDPIFSQLTTILNSDTNFAEEMLPILVYTLLDTKSIKSNLQDIPSRSLLSTYFTSVLTFEQASISCVRTIIDVVLHLRYFQPPSTDALANNKWLDIDYTLLSSKAILCGAYTTALLFLELASDHKMKTDTPDVSSASILYEIYAHIEEPDGFYGIETKDLHQFLIKRFHHEKQWEKAFRFHGAALEADKTLSWDSDGLLQSFHSFGFDHLAVGSLQSFMNMNQSVTSTVDMSYRLGWRTETWDLPERKDRIKGASLYKALRAIHRERNCVAVDGAVRSAIHDEMDNLRTLGPENVIEIREIIQNLMCLNQISQWRQTSTQSSLSTRIINESLWTSFAEIDSGFDFIDLESIMATRMSMIRSVRMQEQRQQIGKLVTPFTQGLINLEKQGLLRLSEAAREAGHVQIALNSIIRAQKLEIQPSFNISQEFANVLWLQKEEKLAVQYLHDIEGRYGQGGDESLSSTQRAALLARLGSWTSEACLEKPADIWTRYFDPAISVLNETEEQNVVHATVYHKCAIFAERQYHAIIKSPDAIRWEVYVNRKKHEIQQRNMELAKIQSNSSRATKLKHDQERAQKLLQEDSELYHRHTAARDAFLQQALEMYSRCLESSNEFDNDAAIRLCSLWFANFNEDHALQEVVGRSLERIPSIKLVFLSHQLTARLSCDRNISANQENLQRLILRMCKEHPFHSLYQVYCLQPEHSITLLNRRQSGRLSISSTQTDRGIAALDIFDRLRIDEITGQRIRDVEKLCDASLQWAKYPITHDNRYASRKTSPFLVPDELLIRSIENLKVPVATYHTPLDPTMAYNDCVWVERFDSKFETAGGINLPKISICYGSDGRKYKQLFKGEGNDDMRQDAVMQQVFDLVNTVVARDRETRRRDLRVRGYKIIPLDSQAGLLEFVENTSQMRDWLQKAHSIYRPQDTRVDLVMKRIKTVQIEYPGNTEKQVSVFLEMRKNFLPVMRHYFTEKHKTPMSWFTMRLKYTRSVATSSIVGHILGLGDRHTSNILIDNVSGEVVHIDFGIAFDQGKLLKVPERVPFRMTADIVDGMGVSGTQGVCQRCAEETLRVLRKGSEVIMTVLEVFKHDPLHSWTASDVKVKRAQQEIPISTGIHGTSRHPTGIGIDMSSGTAEEAADRALSSVARKLDKSLSVECTVNELIAEAMDAVNLATIFYGWGPYF